MSNEFEFYESMIGGSLDPHMLEHRANFIGRKWKLPPSLIWSGDADLEVLLSPLGLKKFNTQVLNKSFYHFKANLPNRFDRYLTLDKFGQLFAENRVPLDLVRYIDSNQQHISEENKALVNFVEHVFLQHGSIVARQLHKIDVKIAKLQEKLTQWSGRFVNTNCYLTPGGGRSLPWHWDNHDTFLLQIHGSKDWEIFERAFPLPLMHHNHSEFKELDHKNSKILKRIRINQGDILYIPRGFPHRAQATSEDPSLHLTFGFISLTWRDVVAGLINKALLECDVDINFRGEVSDHEDGLLKPSKVVFLKSLLKKVFSNIDIEQHQSVIQNLKLKLGESSFILDKANAWKSLSKTKHFKNDQLFKKSGKVFFIRKTKSKMCELVFETGFVLCITFPKSYFNALKYIKEHYTFRIKDIPTKGLPKSGSSKLIQLLFSKGIVCNSSLDLNV